MAKKLGVTPATVHGMYKRTLGQGYKAKRQYRCAPGPDVGEESILGGGAPRPVVEADEAIELPEDDEPAYAPETPPAPEPEEPEDDPDCIRWED